MNTYTKRSDITESSDYILNNCDLLCRENCVVVDDVVYEYCKDISAYRFFFNCDDYDYLEDNNELVAKLDKLRQ